jgi:membrane peptidoglycan carboxypeptidase
MKRGPRSRWRRRLLRVALAACAVVVALVLSGVGYVLSLPGVGDAEAKVHQVLATHHAGFVALPVPTKLAAAVVAVEDEHFYSNIFVDIIEGAGRAAFASGASGDPGGSTIAQQLAKRLYADGSGITTTFEQLGFAVKLSFQYSKPQALDMYLNAVYYGNGYWGAEAAAEGYFGLSPRSLDWAEAAMLAGLPQAPSAYDPLEHLQLAKSRQIHVLTRLVATRNITQAEANAASREKLPFKR